MFISNNSKMASSSSCISTTTLMHDINCAINDLLVVLNVAIFDNSAYEMVLFRFGNLKLFVHFTKLLGNDPSLRSLLLTIEDTVHKKAEEIHNARLYLSGEATLECWAPTVTSYSNEWFTNHFKSWEGRIEQFYATLLDTSRTKTAPFTVAETYGISACVKRNISLFCNLDSELKTEMIREQIIELEVQTEFLISLAVFTPASDGLWAHILLYSVYAANFLLICGKAGADKYNSKEMVSGMLRNLKPIYPRVYENYTQQLRNSKSGRRRSSSADRNKDRDEDDQSAERFINSLMSVLWEMQRDTHGEGSLEKLRELYEGLGSLKVILSQNNFDMETKDRILDVVCDAGVSVCSLYQTQEDQGLQHLFKEIRLIREKFGEKDASSGPIRRVVCVAPLSFVDFLLEKLQELKICEDGASNTRCHAQAIETELVSIRSFMGTIVELRREQEKLQVLWDDILHLAYRIEHLIDYLIAGDLSDSFSTSLYSTMKEIENIKLGILEVQKQETKMKGTSLDDEVVGFLDEVQSIKNRLMRGSKQLRVLPIVGMPGQGKTTLATKVYGDPSISCHFSVCAQTYVSQTVDKRRVLLDILAKIDPSKCSESASDHDLVQKVWRSLKGRRYLIFLDDIWEAEAWSKLKEAFPDDHTASRIMFTSRHYDVVPNEEPHELRSLNEEESMDLLQRRLFHGSGWPADLVQLGKQIATICQGLPLTIVIISGMLATKNPEVWMKVLGGLSLGVVSSLEQCKITLGASYDHLPDHLRPCFLYFATLSAGYSQVSVGWLLRKWIAEGFVRKAETKRIEDVAEEYLKVLIDRNLIMVATRKSRGTGVKACRIHDLLHEFCLRKAKDEGFFYALGGSDKLPAFHPQRLGINCHPKHLIGSSKLFPGVRSLSLSYHTSMPQNLSFMIRMCKLLRVLDLRGIYLGRALPSEMGLLVQLAFLAVGGRTREIPPSIGNLYNLETFMIEKSGNMAVSLPDSFWNLQKLRYLCLPCVGGSLTTRILDSSSSLCKLDWLSGLAISFQDNNMEELLKKFPQVRKLKCILLGFPDETGNHVKVVVPDRLRKLESLSLRLYSRRYSKVEFSLPANLKKLTLKSFHLYSDSLSTISELPNLEVLKLESVSFEGDEWTMEEGEFSNLKFLLLKSPDLLSWSASEDQFDRLEKLRLRECLRLEELPSCLENVSSLEVIEVKHCSDTVLEWVGKLKEDYNPDLKIVTGK